MYPVLVVMYVRLARREEHEVEACFGDAYCAWAAATPAFVPRGVTRGHVRSNR
jgi:protein-S-isoprenylcysteine O-methyltransferase Ste14